MPDEPSTATTDATEQSAAPDAAPVDYNAMLDQIPDDVLTRHRRFNGIVGSHAQRLAEQERQRIAAEEYTKAEIAAKERLRKLAQDNPFQFSQEWLGEEARKQTELEITELRTKAQTRLFDKIASSYAALPEWQQLTPDEFAKVQQKVVGKSDEDLVAAFNEAALDVLADRRAQSRASKEVSDRLAAERAAWEQEARAAQFRNGVSPDMTPPMSAQGLSDVQAIKGMTDREFNDWYERTQRR